MWGCYSAPPAPRSSPIVIQISCRSCSSSSNDSLWLPTYLLWLYLLQVLVGLPTSLAEDEAALLQLQGNTGRGAQALHSRLSRKRCLTASRDACDDWAARPTATASLRRPWKVIIRTSG